MLLVRTHVRAYTVFSHRLARKFMFPLPKSSSHQGNKYLFQCGLLPPIRDQIHSRLSSKIYSFLRGFVAIHNYLYPSDSSFLIHRRCRGVRDSPDREEASSPLRGLARLVTFSEPSECHMPESFPCQLFRLCCRWHPPQPCCGLPIVSCAPTLSLALSEIPESSSQSSRPALW